MKKIVSILGAALLTLSLPLSSSAANHQRFSDVPATKHFAEAVNDLADRNIIGGYPDKTFRPGESITRGQAAAIIVKMTHLDTSAVTNPEFKDVSMENGYYKAIAALSEKGVIKGYGDGRFGPNDNITRGQIASILIKAFELPLYEEPWHPEYSNSFKDLTYRNSHRAGVYSLYQLNLTTGTTPTTYSPNAAVTRGQAAKLLKASEDVKAEITVLDAKDYGSEYFVRTSGTAPDVLDIEKNSVGSKKQIHLIPKKEGTATLSFSTDQKTHKNYTVNVKKVNGALEISLEETTAVFAAPVELWMNEELKKEEKPSIDAKAISLKTTAGKTVNDQLSAKTCSNAVKQYCHVIQIKQAGDFIATVRYADGKEALYHIQSVLDESKLFYTVSAEMIHEKGVITLTESNKHLGDAKLPKGSEKIATLKRDAGTTTFRITPKSPGSFSVYFPSTPAYDDEPGIEQYGIDIDVKQVGPYLHVTAKRNYYAS